MTQIQFGLILPQLPPEKAQQGMFVENVNRALALVSGHFESMHMIDHLWSDDLESFTSLAYFSALYPQLKFGHTVICQSFRNPALVAKMAATLQLLSSGRFLLGIGTGWFEEEYRAYGYDFPPAGVRVAQLEEALQIIKAMWAEPKTTFRGQFYQVVDAQCEPRPDPIPPVMVGAFKPKTMRITARYADEWNVSSTGIGRYRRLAADFERACAEVGRDPASVRRSWGGGCICQPTLAQAKHYAGTRYDTDPEGDFDFVGTPAMLIEQMQPFVEMGVSSFLVDCGGFPDLTTLELLISEVLPGINH